MHTLIPFIIEILIGEIAAGTAHHHAHTARHLIHRVAAR